MRSRKKPVEFGPLWSVLFVPALFIAAAISVPVAAIMRKRQAARERRFESDMTLRHRTVKWVEVVEPIVAGQGTLLVERFSFKGPVRWWWTRENVYQACPSPLADWFTMTNDEQFRPAVDWCWQRYIGPQGQAVLVVCDGKERLSIMEEPLIFREPVRWVELPHFHDN